jgi:hypothetical protein
MNLTRMPDGICSVSTEKVELVEAYLADDGLVLGEKTAAAELENSLIGHVDAVVPVDTPSQNTEMFAALEPRGCSDLNVGHQGAGDRGSSWTLPVHRLPSHHLRADLPQGSAYQPGATEAEGGAGASSIGWVAAGAGGRP